MGKDKEIKFGYWNIRGYGQAIRLLLFHLNLPFTSRDYDVKSSDWANEKHSLGLEFPNLPYLFDGDFSLTESRALLKYLARKGGVEGKTNEEKARAEMLEGIIWDLRKRFVDLCYSPEASAKKQDYIDGYLLPKLDRMEEHFAKNKFIAGDDVTYVDLMAFDAFRAQTLVAPDAFKSRPNLLAYLKRVYALNGVKECEEKYASFPVHYYVASINGTLPPLE